MRAPRELERDDGVDEPLLGAVVEVAHDPSALLVGGGEHARAGGLDLLQADPLGVALAQLGLQPQPCLGVERAQRALSAISAPITETSSSVTIAEMSPTPSTTKLSVGSVWKKNSAKAEAKAVSRPSARPHVTATSSTASTYRTPLETPGSSSCNG